MEANTSQYFEHNMRNIVYLSQAYSVQVLLSTWAYYPDWVEPALIPAYEEQNVVIRDIADELDTDFIDFMKALPVNKHFWLRDGEHQRAAGYLEQATLYAEVVAEIISQSDRS